MDLLNLCKVQWLLITKNINNNPLNKRRNIRVIGQGDALIDQADFMYRTCSLISEIIFLLKKGELHYD